MAVLQQFIGKAFIEEMMKTIEIYDVLFGPEEMANRVVHPVTKETITKFKQLITDPITWDVFEKAMFKKLGRLTQGYGEIGSTHHTKGTDTMRFLDLQRIKNILQDRIVTYVRIVVDYHKQKKDPTRVRITVGGNLPKGTY